jgi:uncharacterized protein YndB with AHSA1/START domain
MATPQLLPDDDAIVVTQAFDTSPTLLWQMITEPAHMHHWYFQLPGFKAEAGYQFSFNSGPEDRTYLHVCEVTEVIPLKKISYTWRYKGYVGHSFVSFELEQEGATTQLRLTHKGVTSFPATNADFARRNFVAGWQFIIGTSLLQYAAKQSS